MATPLVQRAASASVPKEKGISRTTSNASNSLSNDQHLLDPVRCSRLGSLRDQVPSAWSKSFVSSQTHCVCQGTSSMRLGHLTPEPGATSPLPPNGPHVPDLAWIHFARHPLQDPDRATLFPRRCGAQPQQTKSPPLIVWMPMLAMSDQTSPSHHTSTAACANRQHNRHPQTPLI